VGEAPGRNEDEQNIQFVGKSGRKLEDALDRVGIDFRRDCLVTNAIICRPEGNRTPTDKELSHCRPNLTRTIRDFDPHVIVPVGVRAVKACVSHAWKDDIGEMGRWTGWTIPDRLLNAWICPVWHPAYVGRENNPLLDAEWHRSLRAISRLETRPYGRKGAADLTKRLELFTDPDAAARRIRGIMALGSLPASFDFETNCLKPETPRAAVYSCSICWEGKTTIAFTWEGEAAKAGIEFLESSAPKRGHHIKFETRWARRALGVRVSNWQWCSMEATHTLDNRPKICGLKFQAYVRLGYPDYDSRVKPYLENTSRDGLNRIHRAPVREVLEYNALDSLLEWRLSELQITDIDRESDSEKTQARNQRRT
jgi:uracil-DNA glycosylase family 4